MAKKKTTAKAAPAVKKTPAAPKKPKPRKLSPTELAKQLQRLTPTGLGTFHRKLADLATK